jgi:hypothetical protein
MSEELNASCLNCHGEEEWTIAINDKHASHDIHAHGRWSRLRIVGNLVL